MAILAVHISPSPLLCSDRSTCSMNVFHGAQTVLPNRRIVHVLNIVLFTDFANLGSNVRVPGRRHAGEQVVLNLKVESTRQCTSHCATVRARRLNLGLEPTHLVVVRLLEVSSGEWIAFATFKMMEPLKLMSKVCPKPCRIPWRRIGKIK